MTLSRVLRRGAGFGLLFLLAFSLTLAVVGRPRVQEIRAETAIMAERHLAYRVDHPGWSFPARVWSAPAELDQPTARLVEQARARNYNRVCPVAQPGDFCDKTGDVIPRGGPFLEGPQPPGREGWTRPLALEPVLLGWLIGDNAEIREHLPLKRAPKHLINAILAAEDDAYYQHFGVNLRGVARAAWANYQGTGVQQGASTITMQVVRNLSQRKDRTLQRKVFEAVAAVALDHDLGKDAVLQIYLDAPYLGQWGSFSICGFEAAARFYYGVGAADLDLAQAATLASILPAPGRFSPDRHPDAARERRDRTLKRMVELGMLGLAEAAEAMNQPAQASQNGLPEPIHPAYFQATRAWLEEALPREALYGSGLQVHTALDLVAQARTETLLPKEALYLQRVAGQGGKAPLEVAGALLDVKTGLLVATYGGTQELPTDFNRATQARRQAGSSIKPVVYSMLLNQTDESGALRYQSNSTVRNSPRVFPDTDGWSPRNVGGDYSATTTLAQGLAWSQNVAAASALELAGGPTAFKAYAATLGFDTTSWRDEMGLSLGTGEVTPLEMARFVATVLDGGRLASGRPVVQATDAAGTLRVPAYAPRAQVIDARAAALTRSMMRLVIEYGTGGASRGASGKPGYNGPAVGKTGTTDSEKDLWFVGGTGDYASAMWLGYDQPKRIGASASDLAAPLWGWWMHAVHQGMPPKELPGLPATGRSVCTQSGLRGNGSCRGIGAPFLDSDSYPKGVCSIQHPPPAPEQEKYEGLWKRMAREADEKAAAQGATEAAP